MEIVRCSNCSKETYARQTKCPHCGVLLANTPDSLKAEIAETLAIGEKNAALPGPDLRDRLDHILVTTETSLAGLEINKRHGIVVSNIPDREISKETTMPLVSPESNLSPGDMYNVAFFDLRYQALRLGANAVIAIRAVFTPIASASPGLFLSAMGTAVSIEGLRGEAEEEAASRHAPLGRGASPRGR